MSYPKSLKRLTALGVAAGVFLFSATAATAATAVVTPSAAQAKTSSADKTFKVALLNDVDTLNPFTNVLAAGANALALSYEPLVENGQKSNELTGAIADSWEVNEDGTVWTFKLGTDRKWSDGKPLTSDDVVYTFDLIMKNPDLQKSKGALVEGLSSVEAPDAETVKITLSEPQAANPGVQIPIVPKHVWEKIDDKAAFANDKDAVSSGPYTIETYGKSSGITMATNPNYWRGAAKIDKIVFVPYKSTDAAIQALRTGEVDFVPDMTSAQFGSLENEPNVETYSGKNRRYQAVAINPGAKDKNDQPMGDGNPVLQDLVVRQAIVRAIDKSTLLDKVLGGHGTLAAGEIPSVYPDFYWKPTDSELTLSFDPAAANKMLDDAGYAKGADGIRVDKTGKPIKLRLMGRSESAAHASMAEFIKPWLKDIGIDVTVETKASGQVNEESEQGKYDMYFTGWGIEPDPDFQLSINTCASRPNADGSAGLNESNWCDPEFDKLYAAQHVELDPEKRSELVKEADKFKYTQAVNNVIWYYDSLEAYRSDRFGGFEKQPDGVGPIYGQNGPWGFYSVTPVSELEGANSESTSQNSGSSLPIGLGVGIGAVVLIGAVVAVIMRRRSSSDDRA